MSTVAVDTQRTNERLSAFLSEIGANEPVNNTFVQTPTLDWLMKNQKSQDGGRQILFPIDSGRNTTVKYFSDFDTFDTSGQDTALTVIYPFINLGGTIVISWEEIRETAGNDHRIFDLIQHRRKNVMGTMRDTLAQDIYAATQDLEQITTLNVMVDSTGTTGSLSQATDADWAAKEVTSAGSFATNGLNEMRELWNDIVLDQPKPSVITTTQVIHEAYENLSDNLIRYAKSSIGDLGFDEQKFKSAPIIMDDFVPTGQMYMINNEHTFFMIDTEGNFNEDSFESPTNQKVSVAKVAFRGNLITNRRRANGKITGITTP